MRRYAAADGKARETESCGALCTAESCSPLRFETGQMPGLLPNCINALRNFDFRLSCSRTSMWLTRLGPASLALAAVLQLHQAPGVAGQLSTTGAPPQLSDQFSLHTSEETTADCMCCSCESCGIDDSRGDTGLFM